MPAEVSLASEKLAAELALERLLAGVDEGVLAHLRSLAEALAAMLALVQSDVHVVDAYVLLQVPLAQELARAEGAGVLFGAAVQEHVVLEVARGAETLLIGANRTDVRLDALVNELVTAHVGGTTKALVTEGALERFCPRVGDHVTLEIGLVVEVLPADVALMYLFQINIVLCYFHWTQMNCLFHFTLGLQLRLRWHCWPYSSEAIDIIL